MVGRMQVVEEAIDKAADLPGSAGVLPPDGGVQQRLERELESARLEYARQMLREEDYSSEGAGSDGYEGGVEESFSARADGGFDRVAISAECDGDVQCGAAVTAVTAAEKAGVQQDQEGVDGVGAPSATTLCSCAQRRGHAQVLLFFYCMHTSVCVYVHVCARLLVCLFVSRCSSSPWWTSPYQGWNLRYPKAGRRGPLRAPGMQRPRLSALRMFNPLTGNKPSFPFLSFLFSATS